MSTSSQLFVFLASASPRRRELLAQLGISCEVCGVDIDERVLANELPGDYVMRLALAKAIAAREKVDVARAPVLAADTAVVAADGEILGKPVDQEDAEKMLGRLQAATHVVMTGVALVGMQQEIVLCSSTEVDFGAISSAEMAAYWTTGEPADKAGGYGIQGKGAVFVSGIRGSYSGVMGLPLYETAGMLREFGFQVMP